MRINFQYTDSLIKSNIMGKTHHVHATIAYLLKRSDDDLAVILEMDGAVARKQLEERAARGDY